MKPPFLTRTHTCILALLGSMAWVHGHASGGHTPAAPKAATASSSVSMSSAPAWSQLTPTQKQVLRPLTDRWSEMDDGGRAKWVNVANRFGSLSAAEQQRVQERMSQWAKLPPQERGEARLRFQQTRQISPTERQQKWDAYQALPDADRQDLTRQAQRKAKPVFLADNTPGPREASQAFSTKRAPASATASSRKSNVVPTAPTKGTAPGPTVVAPTLVKAGPGATTTLVTQAPTPPMHQHSGLPKISASKTFIDPVTLLPKKGAQSAAMASQPVASSADQPIRR
jgi:hypothetical protein